MQRQLLQIPSATCRVLPRFTVPSFARGRVQLRAALDGHFGDATVAVAAGALVTQKALGR